MKKHPYRKTAVLAGGAAALAPVASHAQDVQTEITSGIGDMITNGGAVAVAAIGIFVAVMAVQVIKKFARAGK